MHEQVVEVFLGASFLEGEDAVHQNEKNDSEREQVNLGSVVGLALFNFWRHICHGTTVALKAIDVFVACEAEVCNFEVQLVVYEKVLEF